MQPPNQVVIDLPWPPSVNRYWRNVSSLGRTIISKEGREYRAAVIRLVSAMRLQPIVGALSVTISAAPPDRRKRDLDNLLKAPLDALTHALLWQDDGQIDDLRIRRLEVEKPGRLTIVVQNAEDAI